MSSELEARNFRDAEARGILEFRDDVDEVAPALVLEVRRLVPAAKLVEELSISRSVRMPWGTVLGSRMRMLAKGLEEL